MTVERGRPGADRRGAGGRRRDGAASDPHRLTRGQAGQPERRRPVGLHRDGGGLARRDARPPEREAQGRHVDQPGGDPPLRRRAGAELPRELRNVPDDRRRVGREHRARRPHRRDRRIGPGRGRHVDRGELARARVACPQAPHPVRAGRADAEVGAGEVREPGVGDPARVARARQVAHVGGRRREQVRGRPGQVVLRRVQLEAVAVARARRGRPPAPARRSPARAGRPAPWAM